MTIGRFFGGYCIIVSRFIRPFIKTLVVQAYADPGNLVLVLGCSEAEEAFFRWTFGLKSYGSVP